MQRQRFQSVTLGIKHELLSEMIDICLSRHALTRHELGDMAAVSEVTAGKLLRALDECGFTELTYRWNEKGGSPARLHSLCQELGTLVIDISSGNLSASVIDGRGKCRMHIRRKYDGDMEYFENIAASFSEVLSRVRTEAVSVASVCLIFDGKGQNREELCSVAAEFFGIEPSLCIGRAEAITNALKYRVREDLDGSGVAHIYFGDTLSAAYYSGGEMTVCRLGELLAYEGTTLSELLVERGGEADLSRALAMAVNFVSCAYSPKAIVIECDGFDFNSRVLSRIKSDFSRSVLEMPRLSVSECAPGLAHLGAAAASSALLIKKHIRGI